MVLPIREPAGDQRADADVRRGDDVATAILVALAVGMATNLIFLAGFNRRLNRRLDRLFHVLDSYEHRSGEPG